MGQATNDKEVKVLASIAVTVQEQAAHEAYLDTLDKLVNGRCAWRKAGDIS
jgi:hypothetical protein